MAGPLFFMCGESGALLDSLEEAQEHEELTAFSTFSKSTESTLNLIFSCRVTHRRLEGELGELSSFIGPWRRRSQFDFEVPKISVDSRWLQLLVGVTGLKLYESSGIEMAVPEVDKKLLRELEAMGFSTIRATRGLHYSGNADLENAINWVIEHENDPDIDQMPLVPMEIKIEGPMPTLTTEEVKIKAQEVREQAHKKKEEEDKRTEREREKERIRVGKELQESKHIEEDNERRRILAWRKAEKKEEERARERICLKLEADKAERRRKLGLPPEVPAAMKPPTPAVQEKKISLPVKLSTKTEHMRECLRSIKQNHKVDDAKVKRAFQTLLIYVRNVVESPNAEKFRKIRLKNPSFQDRVGNLKGGIEFLELCGFEKIEGGEFLFLPDDKVDMAVLKTAASELSSAIANPFFGVLSSGKYP